MKFTVGLTGEKELRAKIEALYAAVDTEEILDEAVAILLNRIRTRFLREEGPDGPWPQSKGAAIRRAGGYTYSGGGRWTGTGTLFASGRLFHSIQEYDAGPNERKIGTDVEYGLKHQLGIGQVQRVFLGFNEDDVDVVNSLILKRINKALK